MAIRGPGALPWDDRAMPVGVDDVRAFASGLPRTTEGVAQGRMEELVLDAWAMVVPEKLLEEYA